MKQNSRTPAHQPVMVNEPTVEDTISILRGLKERYEIYHGVRIHDNALGAAATLSDRYITEDVYKRQGYSLCPPSGKECWVCNPPQHSAA